MTSIIETSLVAQREKLRQQLQEQRKLIARQLSSGSKGNNGYPRSATMRFLTKRPVLVSGLLAELAILLTGARLFKLLGALLALVKILHPALINEQKQLPAPQILNTKTDN